MPVAAAHRGPSARPRSRLRSRREAGVRVVALLGAEAAALLLLHRLGRVDGLAVDWGDPGTWLQQAAPEEALGALLRLVALGAAWWLLASTVVCLVATLWPGRGRATSRTAGSRLTLPFARRLVEHALGVSLFAGAWLGALIPGPAAAWGPAPPPAPVSDEGMSGTAESPVAIDRRAEPAPPAEAGDVRAGRDVERVPVPPAEPAPPTTTTAPPPAPAPAPPAPPGPGPVAPAPGPTVPATAPVEASGSHVVTAGEHLWSIAADVVAAETGRDAAGLGDGDIAPYWARLVEVNRPTLRSGHPDLVFPGETVVLPPR